MPAPDILINAKARDFLTGEFRKIEKSLARTEKRGKKNFEGLNKAARSFTSTLRAGKLAIAGLFAGRAVRSVGGLVTSVTNLADEYVNLSSQLGLSIEFLSEMRFVAANSNIEFEKLRTGIQGAARRFEEFRFLGTGEAVTGLKILGRDIEEAVRQGKSMERLLPLLADRFRELSSEQRILASKSLFDSDNVAFLRFLNKGSKEIANLRREARRLGLTLDSEAAAKAAVFNAELQRFTSTIEGLKTQVVIEFLPALTAGLERLSKFLHDNRFNVVGFFRAGAIVALDFAAGILTVVDAINGIPLAILKTKESIRDLFFVFESDDDRNARHQSQEIKDATKALQERLQVTDKIRAQIEKIQNLISSGALEDFFTGVADKVRAARDEIERLLASKPVGPLELNLFDSARIEREVNDVIEFVNSTFRDRLPTTSPVFLPTREDDRRERDEALARINQEIREIEEQQDAIDRARERAKEQFQSKSAIGGLQKFFEQAREEATKFGEAVTAAANQATSALAGGLTNEILAFASGAKSAKEAWRDFAKQLLADLARIAIQLTINKAIQGAAGGIGGLFGAAKGGVFPGHFAPAPGLASGGVVSRRGTFQLAEAGQFEAVVPLPDNRRIPVKILNSERMVARGGDRPFVVENVNFNMSFPNVRNSEDARRAADQIAAAHVRRLKESQSFNDLHDAA